jgi:hypothetical protein
LKVRYLHSDIDAIDGLKLRGLRAADFDILVESICSAKPDLPRFRSSAFWMRTRKDFCEVDFMIQRRAAQRV